MPGAREFVSIWFVELLLKTFRPAEFRSCMTLNVLPSSICSPILKAFCCIAKEFSARSLDIPSQISNVKDTFCVLIHWSWITVHCRIDVLTTLEETRLRLNRVAGPDKTDHWLTWPSGNVSGNWIVLLTQAK